VALLIRLTGGIGSMLPPHTIGTCPARLRRRLAEIRFASPLVGSGRPRKRTSESRGVCGAMGASQGAGLRYGPPMAAVLSANSPERRHPR
jgi:hypothetical protein